MNKPLKGIMVCVDYADLLALTLPYNRHHFHQLMVVTTEQDRATRELAVKHHCLVYETDAFYRNGATFNKWLALEEGLDRLGRDGWMCIMDADVCWPKIVPTVDLKVGKLYTPERRMCPTIPQVIPSEDLWGSYELHRNRAEWAGYSQIFHAKDPVLKGAGQYWHEIDWKHAGGADSFFQMRWDPKDKVRPPFEVLHLGLAGHNWFGRATPLADGTVLDGSEERMQMSTRKIWEQRRVNRANGLDQFDGEKIVQSK